MESEIKLQVACTSHCRHRVISFTFTVLFSSAWFGGQPIMLHTPEGLTGAAFSFFHSA
jgi:hypothetical protein